MSVAGNIAAVPLILGQVPKKSIGTSKNLLADSDEGLKRVFAANFRAAWDAYMKREGRRRMSRRELAELVSAEMGKEKPLDQSTVRDWENGETLPTHGAGLALVRVLDIPYGALFGQEAMTPNVEEAGSDSGHGKGRKRGGG